MLLQLPSLNVHAAATPAHVQVLDNSPYQWLHEMLEVFNTGDLHAYDALCTKYASVLNGQPALVEHERRLREKVCSGFS